MEKSVIIIKETSRMLPAFPYKPEIAFVVGQIQFEVSGGLHVPGSRR